MSLGLPNFNFIFQSKGVSAIERSARGIVAVILKDDTEGEEQNVYNKVDDVDFTQWTEDNYNYLKLIYEGAPSKVIAMRVATNVESYNAVLKKLKDLKWNYLCIPGIKAADTTMIGAWIKQYRNDEKKTFKVVLPHYAGDHEGIINFTTENITSSVTGKKHTAAEYCARIAGILAGLSLSRSSTFYVLNDVSSAEVPDDPNERIDAGELILTFDGSQYKIGRGVNSLTSFTATKTEDFRKIKIVEGMDLYMDDIRDTFEKYYVGKVINDYDNKQMFVAAISSYHKELLGDDEDVEQDEYERHTDKVFSDRLARYERSGKSGEDVVNPWDEIEDIKSDPFTLLFPEDAPMDEKVAAILEFMEGLTEAQRDLVYDHLGAWKYLEDVRREEEARTGKTVTQQAISNRWNKIIAKGCKHFGVEKSRKRKK